MDEIAAAFSDISPDAEIIETAEAHEYRESQAIRAQRFKERGEAGVRGPTGLDLNRLGTPGCRIRPSYRPSTDAMLRPHSIPKHPHTRNPAEASPYSEPAGNGARRPDYKTRSTPVPVTDTFRACPIRHYV